MNKIENIWVHSITEDPKFNSPKGVGVVIEYNDVVQDCLGLCFGGTKYKSDDGETFLTLTFVVYEEYHPPKKKEEKK